MSKWEMVRLGDVADLITKGTTPTTLGYTFQQDGINFVKVECIAENGAFLKNKFEHISDECNQKLKRSILEKGDILFSIAGALGRTAIVTDEILPANINQALAIIRISKADIALDYVITALQSENVFMQFQRQKQGVAQLNLSLKNIADLEIPLPPLPVQQQIADVLDRASALIEKRKAQIEKLDLLVKSQFVEMFGDPVTNPMGWETSLLKDVCTFSNGKAHEQHIDENGSFKLVTSKFIASGGELYRKTSDQLFPLYKGDICMVMSDVPNGRALAKCFLVDADNTYSLNQRICVFKTQSFDLVFLYHLLNRHPYFLSFNDGDSQTNLRKEEILNCQLILPSLILQNEFTRFVQQVETQKFILQKSLAKMEQNYKSLMQKCFRGEIF